MHQDSLILNPLGIPPFKSGGNRFSLAWQRLGRMPLRGPSPRGRGSLGALVELRQAGVADAAVSGGLAGAIAHSRSLRALD
jgi:hypothetical protein